MHARSLIALASLVLLVPAARAEFSNASLNGRFTGQFHLYQEASAWNPVASVLLQFDGAGHVTGQRIVQTWNFQGDLPLAPTVQRQTLTGTYSVDADGIGRMDLSASPALTSHQERGGVVWSNSWQVGPDETWSFIVNRGGAGFSFTGTAAHWISSGGQAPVRSDNLTWTGDAVSQDSPCGEAVSEVTTPRTRRQ